MSGGDLNSILIGAVGGPPPAADNENVKYEASHDLYTANGDGRVCDFGGCGGFNQNYGAAAAKRAGEMSFWENVSGSFDLLNQHPASLAIPAGRVAKGLRLAAHYVNPAQAKNIARWMKKVPENSKQTLTVDRLPGSEIKATVTSAGKVPGSKAVYQKHIDVNGNTVSLTQKAMIRVVPWFIQNPSRAGEDL